jgi:1-acyl-sn-glycerol-3-phosphate acyltransferase
VTVLDGRTLVTTRAIRSALDIVRSHITGTAPPLDADSLDPALIASVLPFVRLSNRRYLRLRAEGFENLGRGPVLYVGNHNGGIAGPDICCTLGSLWDARGPEAPLYALAHDFAMRHVQLFGAIVQRFGALRAKPENALRALRAGAQVLVYPGGDLDAYRHARRRDEVVLGPRTGFVRVAQLAGVPIVPIVAHGAHRNAYIFSEGKEIARLLRLKERARGAIPPGPGPSLGAGHGSVDPVSPAPFSDSDPRAGVDCCACGREPREHSRERAVRDAESAR